MIGLVRLDHYSFLACDGNMCNGGEGKTELSTNYFPVAPEAAVGYPTKKPTTTVSTTKKPTTTTSLPETTTTNRPILNFINYLMKAGE